MTLLRKLINKVNNWKRTARKNSISLSMMVLESHTGKDFHVLLSSSTHKVFGWHGDAKKWCGAHLMPILQTCWVFGKDLSKDLFILVWLKERMTVTKSLLVHGWFLKNFLIAYIRPCILPTKCSKILKILLETMEMKSKEPSKFKVSLLVPLTRISLKTKDKVLKVE